MIRRHAAVFRAILATGDAALALLVLAVATSLRYGGLEGWPTQGTNLPDPALAAGVFVGLWLVILWLHGLYRSRARWTIRGELAVVLRATLIHLVLTLSLLFLLKLPDVSRLFLLVVFPLLAAAAIGIRVAMRHLLLAARARGGNIRYMLVVGSNARAQAFADFVESHTELGLVIIGHLTTNASRYASGLRRPLLGRVEDLEAILHDRIVDEVAICLPFSMEKLIQQTSYLCQREGKVVRVPVAPVERVLTAGRLESVDGVGVYTLMTGPDRAFGLLAKRLIDVVAAVLLMVVLSPLLALLAALVKLDSRGPALFRQERVGLNGRTFDIVKFRSMEADAEQQLEELRPGNRINGHAFKLDNDPRITRVGQFLRRSSLDELPQLWNVLRGQMSLVGPRPPLPCEVAEYDIWHRRRLSMKPGMTGLWQVEARCSQDFDRWVEQDLQYIDRWSLWLDAKIIARTVPVVLAGTGR